MNTYHRFIFITIFVLLLLPTAVTAINISECGTLSSDGAYTLNQSISSSGTCMTIGAHNISIDGAGYTINYSITGNGYGINNSAGYDNITIKNLNIIQVNSSAAGTTNYAIFASGMTASNFTNNTINTKGVNARGVSFYSSNTNILSNNTITTSNYCAYGIYLTVSSNSNNISDNIISSAGHGGHGVYFTSTSNSNNIFDNTITTSYVGAHAIYLGSGCNLNNVSNNILTSIHNDAYGLYLYGAGTTLFSNNIISTSGGFGRGIHIRQSHTNTLTNNIITTSGGGAYGVYLQLSDTNTLTNNTISTSNRDACGVYLQSSNTNTLTNNTISTSNAGACGVYLRSSNTNNITGGSIVSQSSYDYYWYDTSTTNNVTDTDFTAQRKIYFYDTTSRFNYNNETDGNIWLQNKVSTAATVSRTLTTWSTTIMEWNDSASTALTSSYNLTGLISNTQYTVKNDSTSRIITTDSNGDLGIDIYLLQNTDTTLYMFMDNSSPTYTNLNINDSTLYRNDSVLFSANWSDDLGGMASYWFSWNDTGSWVNDSAIEFSGTWSNISKKVTSVYNTVVGHTIYANDTHGNINQTTIASFTVLNTEPTASNVAIDPSPANDTDDLNCTYDYSDIDGDVEATQWFEWYVNNVLTGTVQTLSTGNYSGGDEVICSVKVNDGTDNSTTWSNSSTSTIGDTVAPVFYNQTMSSTSGQITTAFTIGINFTESNVLDWVYVEITDPTSSATNYTMTLGTTNTTDHYYIKSYTPATTGTYSFDFYAKDGSSNIGNFTGTQNYTATAIPTPPAPGGGGGESVTCNYNKYCDSNENIASCPGDCIFPLRLDPMGANITLFFGYSTTTSYTLYNNQSYDVDTEIFFRATENDTQTYNLSKFEFDVKRLSIIESIVLSKSPISPGYSYITVISKLPKNMSEGSYQIVIIAQGVEQVYDVYIKTTALPTTNPLIIGVLVLFLLVVIWIFKR